MSIATQSPSLCPRRRWFQFSVATLMLAVTALCLWLADYANPIRKLQRQLRDSNDQVRCEAAYMLGGMGVDAGWAEHSLVTAIHDESPLVRGGAAWAISRIGGNLHEITPLLADSNEGVRLAAGESILWGGGDADAAVSALIRLAASSSHDTESGVENIIEALSAEMAARSIPPLLDGLSNEEPSIAKTAEDALRRVTRPARSATESLLKYLHHSDPRVRVAAAEQLLRSGDKAAQAIGPLRELLSDRNPHVADAAAAALMAITADSEDANRRLLLGLSSDDPLQADRCLKYISQLGPRAAVAVPPLAASLKTASGSTGDQVALALKAIGPVDVAAVADVATNAIAPLRRQRAVDVLASYGPQARDAITAIIAACDDSSAGVRRSAADAMRAIGKDAAPGKSRLVALLRDGDTSVCDAAANALMVMGSLHDSETADLSELLASDDVKHRLRSMKILVRTGAAPNLVLPTLMELLLDSDSQTALDTMEIAEQMGSAAAPAINILIRLLGSREVVPAGFGGYSICQTAARALGATGHESLPQLIEQLANADAQVRGLSARALGLVGPAAKDAVPSLIRRLDDRAQWECIGGCMGSRPEVRHDAAEALGRIGPGAKAAVPHLMGLLKHTANDPMFPVVQVQAVRALGGIGSDARPAVDAILQLSLSEDPQLLPAVALALAKILPDGDVTLRLIRRFLWEAERSTPMELAYDLGELGEAIVSLGQSAAPVVPQLKRMAYEAPLLAPLNRCQAAYSLTGFHDERDRAIEWLRQAAARSNWPLAWSARELLEKTNSTP